jgi:hypothetical protein
VARDGTAELDVLVADLTENEEKELGYKVWSCLGRTRGLLLCFDVFFHPPMLNFLHTFPDCV